MLRSTSAGRVLGLSVMCCLEDEVGWKWGGGGDVIYDLQWGEGVVGM
jgi:hypothetical protein